MIKSESTNRKCAVCGAPVDPYDICEVCGWQDDDVQSRELDYPGGPNRMTLREAIEAYKAGNPID